MRLLSIFSVILFCNLIYFAQVESAASGREAQAVANALKQADRGNWIGAKKTIASLNNSNAQDVLNWYAYTQGQDNRSFDEISNFVSKHNSWPQLDKIRVEAEKKITASVSKHEVISWFSRNQPITPSGMDYYVGALISTGKTNEVRRALHNWWPKADLSRDQQRDFYTRYGRYLDRESHVERLNSLLHKKKYSNAVGIAEALGGGYPALAEARRALSQKSANVNAKVSAVPATLKNNEGLLFDRLKWRRQNKYNDGAIEILNRAPSASRMYNPKDWWKERHIIVRRLIEQKQYKKAYKLASQHKQKEGFPLAQAEWVSGWLALRFVNEPWKAFEHFEKLYKNVSSPLSKSRGAYWAGRASDDLKHPQVASQWYNVALRYPETFYGQLAAEKLNKKSELIQNNPVFVSQSQRNSFDRKDLVQAAGWFDHAGMKKQTELFLLRLSKNAQTPPEYVLTAELSERLGYKHITIKVAQALQKEKGISQSRYLYPQIVRELQNIHDTEWAFINAIIRQESRFDQSAVSHAGARGLMQLMPATAKGVASRSGRQHQTAWLTSRPSHNIYLGSRYLSQMTNRFGGSYALAAAAYNAGPNRVDRWLREFGDPRRGEINLIDWVELIPIYETRNYVQRVLEGVYVYRQKLKGKQKIHNNVIHVSAN